MSRPLLDRKCFHEICFYLSGYSKWCCSNWHFYVKENEETFLFFRATKQMLKLCIQSNVQNKLIFVCSCALQANNTPELQGTFCWQNSCEYLILYLLSIYKNTLLEIRKCFCDKCNSELDSSVIQIVVILNVLCN